MSVVLWNPLTGKYENQTPTTTDNKTTPYSKEPISTAIPMRCTKCGRVTNELHTGFAYPEEHLCPECWRATNPITTFSRTESKEETAYKELKKWLNKQLEYSTGQQDIDVAWAYRRTLKKMKELENEQGE